MNVQLPATHEEKKEVTSPLVFESHFYDLADGLRARFEEQIAMPSGAQHLKYAFSRDTYQFLTAAAEHLFDRQMIDDLIGKLEQWAKRSFNLCHVSTPQVRVYINGCSRSLARDQVSAKWHYVLWLTHARSRIRDAQIRFLTRGSAPTFSVTVHRVVQLQPQFNSLMLNAIDCDYSIESRCKSMDPCTGCMFLDGYIW